MGRIRKRLGDCYHYYHYYYYLLDDNNSMETRYHHTYHLLFPSPLASKKDFLFVDVIRRN